MEASTGMMAAAAQRPQAPAPPVGKVSGWTDLNEADGNGAEFSPFIIRWVEYHSYYQPKGGFPCFCCRETKYTKPCRVVQLADRNAERAVQTGALPFINLNAVDNAVMLCWDCYNKFDSGRPYWFMLPFGLDFFIHFELDNYRERAVQYHLHGTTNRRSVPTAADYRMMLERRGLLYNPDYWSGGVYRRLLRIPMLDKGDPILDPGMGAIDGNFYWHGNPAAAINHLFEALQYPGHWLDRVTRNELTKLSELYGRKEPWEIPWDNLQEALWPSKEYGSIEEDVDSDEYINSDEGSDELSPRGSNGKAPQVKTSSKKRPGLRQPSRRIPKRRNSSPDGPPEKRVRIKDEVSEAASGHSAPKSLHSPGGRQLPLKGSPGSPTLLEVPYDLKDEDFLCHEDESFIKYGRDSTSASKMEDMMVMNGPEDICDATKDDDEAADSEDDGSEKDSCSGSQTVLSAQAPDGMDEPPSSPSEQRFRARRPGKAIRKFEKSATG